MYFRTNKWADVAAQPDQSTFGTHMVLASILNLVIGIVSSCIAALILGPILTTPWSYWLVVQLSKVLGRTSTSVLTGDKWVLTWHVQSANFPASNPSPIKLHRFFNVVGGEWSVTSNHSTILTYRMVGQITHGNRLTGQWFDIDGGASGYSGVLQLVFSYTKDSADGMWIGYSRSNVVKGDVITLKK